ncbi:FAD-binding oxidoreductase, partial [Paraburkholderia sp. Se-20369]|nr:FAD-binding oxidoreductase [Paraburkholderia sp. Se-20369]
MHIDSDRAAAGGEAIVAALAVELGKDSVTPPADIEPRFFTAYNEPPGVRPRALVR